MKMLVGVALGLLVMWIGAYYLLVERNSTCLGVGDGESVMIPCYETYRVGGRFSEWLFAPVHLIDEQFRPDYWTITVTFGESTADRK